MRSTSDGARGLSTDLSTQGLRPRVAATPRSALAAQASSLTLAPEASNCTGLTSAQPSLTL